MAIKGYITACRSSEDYLGNVTGEMEMRIAYSCHPARRETPDSPAEAPLIEFCFVAIEEWKGARAFWVKCTDFDVVEWAERYLESHTADVLDDVAAQEHDAAEHRAEMRREALREDRRHA
jgi:hypothetical protein